jgi:hypothetical protein
MKLKQLFAAALLFCTAGASAQTDVTSTYLTNADFSQGPVVTSDIRGYGKDMVGSDVYGFQDVTGWTFKILSGDNATAAYPNSGMAGAVLAYGSSNQLKGNNVTAPAAGPDESAGQGLGFFGVWGCGGYYYQDVTFAAGKYKLTFPIYCISGTQANTTYTGFFPTSGTNRTVAINTTVGSWVNQTVEFTLASETAGQIRLGYQSTGSGSGANPHLVFDCVKIEFTSTVVKDVLEVALTAAKNANASLGTLSSAIATAQAVYDNASATQDEVNAAAAALNTAVELAMSDAGDASFLIPNLGFEDCTVTTTNAAAGGSAAPLDIAGDWTQTASAAWSSSAVVEYGGEGQVNGASAPAADNLGNGGYTLGISVGWSGTVIYKSKAATFPAGVYTLKVNAYNALADVTQFKSRVGFAPTSGTAILSTKTAFASSTWETDQVTFTLNEATEGCIQIGGEAFNAGSGSNAKVFFDNITIEYKSFLAGAKAAWDEAKAAANQAIADNPAVTGEELSALNAELGKAEPTTIDGYNAAVAAINSAKDALVAAATSYNALAAVNEMITAAGTLEYADASKKPAVDEGAANATEAASKAAELTTDLREYYESHAMAEGVADAVDMTDKVAAANADTNTGWTNGIGTNQGQGYTDAAGTVAAKYLDGGWASNTGVNIDMTRSVEIPAGRYLLTVTARGAVDLDTYTLSIGGETIDLPHSNGGNGGVFGNGWEDASIEFEADGSAQTLEVIAHSTASQQWISINRFRLVQLEAIEVPMADATDYAALASAIEAAEAKTLGFDKDEYAPYENVEALQALAAAKAIDPESADGNTKEVVQNATSALSNASWTANTEEVDAIFDGDFALEEVKETSSNTQLKGWAEYAGIRQILKTLETFPGLADASAGTAVFGWGNNPFSYGTETGYTMPLDENTLYKLTFKAAGWNGETRGDVTVSVLNGEDGLAATNLGAPQKDIKGLNAEAGLTTFTKYFTTGAAGDYVFTISSVNNIVFTDLSIVKAVAEELTLDEAVAFEQAEETLANVTVKRKIVEGLNAVSLPFALDAEQVAAMFGEGAVVYAFSEEADGTNSQINFNTKAEQTIEANVPVLVKATTASTTQSVNGVIVKTAEAKAAGTNFDFVGNYNGAVTVAAGDYFVSSGKLYKSIGSTTLKGFRAFIQDKNPDVANEVKLFIDGDAIDTDLPTAIDSINANTNGEAYDLSGRKVNAPTQKGVYIIGGKKVAVK